MTRLEKLKAKLAARTGNPAFEGKNLEALRSEIARLEPKPKFDL